MPNGQGCEFGRILEARVVRVESDVQNTMRMLEEIRDQLAGRPSWSVVALITALTSACVGLFITLAGKVS